MSPTNLPYRIADRFYRAAGPALVRRAGLQQLLLGAQGAAGAPNLAEPPGMTAEHSAFSSPVTESSVPVRESSVLIRESSVLMHESSIPAIGVREPAVPALGVREPAVPALGVRWPAVPALGIREPAVPAPGVREPAVSALGVRWPAVSALGIREPAVPALGVHEAAVTGRVSSVLTNESSAPVPAAPAPSGSPTSAPAPMMRGPAAVPGLIGLVEGAARRSRRQHLLLDLAMTQPPTVAGLLQAPPQPAETAGRATAPAEAPAIRFSPPSQSSTAYPGGLAQPTSGPTPLADVSVRDDEAPPGTDDFIFEERVRGVLDRILRTDALRHGLALGER